MKTIILLLAVCSLRAQVVTSQVTVPLYTAVSVNTSTLRDQVTLSGSLNLITQIAAPNPPPISQTPNPPPIRVITTLVNVTGTGQLTGLRYQATGTSIFSMPTPPPIAPAALTFTGSYRMVPEGPPIVPPNPVLPQTSFSLPLSLQLDSAGQVASATVQSGGVLWMGNDSDNPEDVATATTSSGTVLETVKAAVTGVAFDGTNLWFSDPFGKLTRRTSDGNTVLASFPGGNIASTEDMAWDSKRQRLWRMVNWNPALQRIDPATGTIEATYPLPLGDSQTDPIYPRAGMGVAYDPAQDRIYVSFCKVGCSTYGGAVGAFDPSTGTYIGDVFTTQAFLLGGLAFDPATGHLWVAEWDGQEPVIASMSLNGTTTFSSFARPGARFVDGFEFIGGRAIP